MDSHVLDTVLPLDVFEHEVGVEQDRIELVSPAWATLAIVQQDLLAEVFAEIGASLLDACAFLSNHFQGVLAPVGELPIVARLHHSRRWSR